MIRAALFHWFVFTSLRTGWFLPDVALFHSMLLLCLVQHTFLRRSIGRVGGSRAATAVRFTFEAYRRMYELWHCLVGAAVELAERSEPIRECTAHYRATKARFVAGLLPNGEFSALIYLQGSYLSAQLAKDCVDFHKLDPENTAQLLTRICAFVKALAMLVRAMGVSQKLAAEQEADAAILRALREQDEAADHTTDPTTNPSANSAESLTPQECTG